MAIVKNVLPIVQSTKLIGQTVSYYPNIANVINSTDATLFICQFIYWSDNIDENGISNWIKRTSTEIQQFTGVNQNSQVTARKRLINLGILTEKKMGIPSTLHFQFDFNKLNEILSDGLNEEKKDKNPTQKKNEKGRFVSVSEKLGNYENTPVSENPSFPESGIKVSEKVANCNGTFSETTYIRDNKEYKNKAHTQKKSFDLKEEKKDVPPNSAPPPATITKVMDCYKNEPYKILSSDMRDSELFEILKADYLNDEIEKNSFDNEFTKVGILQEDKKMENLKSLCSVYVAKESTGKKKNMIYAKIRQYIGNHRQFEKQPQETTKQQPQPTQSQTRDLSLLAKQVQEKWKQQAAQ